MARYYEISLDTIVLTEDGLSGSRKCKCKINNVNKIQRKYSGTTEPSGDGTQYTVLFDSEESYAKGVDIPIEVNHLDADVLLSIIELHKSKAISSEPINLVAVGGDPGNFNIQVVPIYPDPVEGGDEFSTGILKSVKLNYRTT